MLRACKYPSGRVILLVDPPFNSCIECRSDRKVELISQSRTHEGLMFPRRCYKIYPTDLKVTDEELAALNLVRDASHGEWNYTIRL
jgi:Rhodopirellula transposase DDE domain